MKVERSKNSIKGIISGVVNKFVLLLLPFIVKSVFINTLGMEYFGLNSLFTSILNILNLAELGVGTAISYSMYAAIANNDKKRICALTKLYKKIYSIIGFVILIIGLLILPFIKHLCNYDVPNNINIYIIYIMYLVNTVLTYWMFSYKSCILVSHQQNYIINIVNTIVNLLLNILQIFVLIFIKNYYIYLGLLIASTIIYNIVISIIVNNKYKEYFPIGEIEEEEKNKIYKKVKALFYYKIGSVVLTSVDSVVISYYLGLTELGKYNSYYYVITALFGFFQIIQSSLVAGVGNSIELDSVEKNKKDFDKLNFVLGWIVGFCTICLLCLYQRFIYLWIGQENMFEFSVVILLSIYFYVWKMMEIVNVYKDAAGLWEYDKYRPLVASAVNLVLNIVLVQIIGIYGIIISTIVSILFIIFPWSTYILFKKYFNKGYINYLKRYFINAAITTLGAIITLLICNKLGSYEVKNFILCILLCMIIPNVIFSVCYYKSKQYDESVKWLNDKMKLKKLDGIFKIWKKMSIVLFSILILVTMAILIK